MISNLGECFVEFAFLIYLLLYLLNSGETLEKITSFVINDEDFFCERIINSRCLLFFLPSLKCN